MCLWWKHIDAEGTEIEWRPYRKNYSCELHKSNHRSSCSLTQKRMIAFAKRRSWGDCSLSTKASNSSTFPRKQSMGTKIKVTCKGVRSQKIHNRSIPNSQKLTYSCANTPQGHNEIEVIQNCRKLCFKLAMTVLEMYKIFILVWSR